jgi:hypothetical protein
MTDTPNPRWAYWLKNVGLLDAIEAPITSRLRLAWPHMPDDGEMRISAQPHPNGGTLVVWPGTPTPVQLDAFGEPRETHDGMVFYPSLIEPTPEFLIRAELKRPQGIWVSLYKGTNIHVALATATPKALILSASGPMRSGGFVTEYPELAFKLWDEYQEKEISHTDPRLGRFLFLLVRESYMVTEEMAEDLRWLTDLDIDSLLLASFGVDPKAFAAALVGSASADPATPTSP